MNYDAADYNSGVEDGRVSNFVRKQGWCSDSDALSEAKRNPESSRTAITNSS
jgi:hypothetical protein